jgi:protein-S-isoprenylcysteine O-methyltransferase Ste14
MTNFEERALLVKFGQEYALYQKNVSKWIGQSKSNGQRSD